MYRINRKADGRVYLRHHEYGREKTKYCGRGPEAAARATVIAEKLNAQLRGERASPTSGLTFNAYADRILLKYAGRKAGTYESLRQIIDDHLRPAFGPLPLDAIRRSQIADLVDEKLAAVSHADRVRWLGRLKARLTDRQRRVLIALDRCRDDARPDVTRPVSWTALGAATKIPRRTVGQAVLPRLEALHLIARGGGKVRVAGAPGGFAPSHYRLLLSQAQLRTLVADPSARRRLKLTPYGVNTVRNIVSALRLIFNWAVDEEDLTGITRNPAAHPQRLFPARAHPQPSILPSQVWNEPAVAALLAATDRWFAPNDADLVHVLCRTGQRIGEIFGLQWSDFDPREGTLSVARSIRYRRVDGPPPRDARCLVVTSRGHVIRYRLIVTPTRKSGRGAAVELDDDLRRRLERRRDRLEVEAAMQGRPLSEWVFPASEDASCPERPGGWDTRVWRPVLRHAAVHPWSPGRTRHTYGSLCYRHTGDIAYVQSQLGHERPETTAKFYVHFRPATRVRTGDYRNAFWEAVQAAGRGETAVEPVD